MWNSPLTLSWLLIVFDKDLFESSEAGFFGRNNAPIICAILYAKTPKDEEVLAYMDIKGDVDIGLFFSLRELVI